jgi:hypothetical protein
MRSEISCRKCRKSGGASHLLKVWGWQSQEQEYLRVIVNQLRRQDRKRPR